MEIRPLRLKNWDMLREVMANYWQEANQARESGKLVAWCTALAPVDILVAMDVFPIFPENHCAACGTAKVGGIHCEIAESYGFSFDTCSYARNDIGSVLAGEQTSSPIGGLPHPDLVLACDNQCNTVNYWYEFLGRYFNVPVVLIDTPFFHDWFGPEDVQAALRYVRQQLEEMVMAVEGLTGRRFNYDRLQQCLEHTRKAATLWREVQEICRNVPSPLTSFDHFMWLFPIVVLRGFAEAVTCLEALATEAEERAAQGTGAIPEERYRLYWDNIAVWYKMRELSSRFASNQACPVVAAYPYVWNAFGLSDPSRPLDSMAETLFFPYLNQGVGRRIEVLTRWVKEYSLDGMVMQTSRSCKPFFGGQYELVDAILKATGVPSVLIEGDMVDPRVYSDAEVNPKIDAFLEILAAKKPPNT